MYLRPSRRLGKDALQSEAVEVGRHLIAETAGEIGESGELLRVRIGVDAAQKSDVETRQVLGHRLVGSKHELLDDLMADVMRTKMCACDLSFIVVFQLYFGHV